MKLLRRMLLIFSLIFLLPLTAKAAGNNTITVLHNRDGIEVSGAVFTLYQVDASHANPLEAYIAVVEAGKMPLSTGVTDESGIAIFADLADGVYLLTGSAYTIDDKICEPEMSLIQLPANNETDSPADKVVVIPKYTMRDHAAETAYRVVIIWEDEASTAWRPDAVAVQLFRNGEKYSVVQPDKDVNWQYIWTDTDPLASWAVLETVPDKYKASYSRDGNTYVITNTLQVDTGADSDSKLPQTGQMWWPVPLLAIAGCSLLLLGWLRRKEYMDEA